MVDPTGLCGDDPILQYSGMGWMDECDEPDDFIRDENGQPVNTGSSLGSPGTGEIAQAEADHANAVGVAMAADWVMATINSREDPSSLSYDELSAYIHTALQSAGLIPSVGVFPDAVDAFLYLFEGEFLEAGVSVGAMIPGIGQGVTGFRTGLKATTNIAGDGLHAHHIFSKNFRNLWDTLGVAWNDANFGAWWEAGDHLRNAWRYNQDWLGWVEQNQDLITSDPLTAGRKAIEFSRTLAEKYGFKIYY
jgi:hypothetical protein